MAPFMLRRHVTPKWTFIFIATCVVVFAAEFIVPYFFEQFSFIPSLSYSEPWRFLSSVFLHASVDHLFFNMFALFIFGMYLESVVGRKKFIIIFFLTGIAGNLAYLMISPQGIIPAVGASGAIYGIMGTLAILRPTLIVYVGVIPMPMIVAAVLWTIMEFLGMFVPGNIAHEAHLAGLFLGCLIGFILRKRKRLLYA
jgi:membrane associated rhomboid family serine protease